MLEAARRRPLIDGLTIRRGPNKGELLAKVSDERRAELEQVGRERALIYKMGVLTGLWANELRTLQVNDLSFGDLPFVKLRRSNEKSRKGSTVPLRSDLAAELRRWAQDKPPADRLFNVPTGLLRIMNRDLVAAGIPKVDEDGYVVHIHALRHSFGTHLSKAGVSPRTAQAAMRHSDIKLTMSTYVDARLLDTASAVELLPSLPLEASGDGDVNGADSAENSASEGPRTDAPTVAPNVGDQGHLGSILGHCGPAADSERKRKNPEKLNVFQGFRQSGRQDLNLRPLRPERSALPG